MLHRAIGSLRPSALIVALVASVSSAAPVAGQRSTPAPSDARLQGVVVDADTYQPVEAAHVSVVGTALAATTGQWGSFSFSDAPLGTVSVQVSAPGHPSVVQEVRVTADGVVFLQVVLPSVAAVLSELMVRGGPPRSRASDDAALTAADLLALEVPRTRAASGDIGKSDFGIRLRELTTLTGNADPIVLVDGVVMSRAGDAYEALLRIPAADVLDIQVLKGPAASALYPFAANGVVKVTTKRGQSGR